MADHTYSSEEITAQGEAIYREQIRSLVETTEKGKFAIIDIETGDYEIDTRDATATLRLLERRPGAVTYAVRIGYRTAYRIGGRRLWDDGGIIIEDRRWSGRSSP